MEIYRIYSLFVDMGKQDWKETEAPWRSKAKELKKKTKAEHLRFPQMSSMDGDL